MFYVVVNRVLRVLFGVGLVLLAAVSSAVGVGTTVFGAVGEDAESNNAGPAYVFQEPAPPTATPTDTPTPTNTLTPTDTPTPTNTATPTDIPIKELNELKKLTGSDAPANAAFGWSAALSGDTAIVGANNVAADGRTGAAYVFYRDQGGTDNWGEVKRLLASDAERVDFFGHSVAISSDTAIVGAFFEDTAGADAGAAYIFKRNEGGADNWGEVKKLIASDADAGDEFGISVAMSGDVIIVGAAGETANKAGAAYIFHRDEGGLGNWGEVKKLTASDAQTGIEFGEQFGVSVAVSGDAAIVGADIGFSGATRTGAAYVFHRDEGGVDNWGEVKKLTASDGASFDGFGFSVGVSGDTAVVGAKFKAAGPGVGGAGAGYVFQRSQGGADNWGEVKKLTAADAETFDAFGHSVAVSGDIVIVGAHHEDSAGDNGGTAYVFQRNAGGVDNWGEMKRLFSSDAEAFDTLGQSVAVSGGTALVGADHEDGAATNAGAAYVFDLLEPKPTPTPTITATPTITPTPPPAVGGIALDSDASLRPLTGTGTSSGDFGLLAWAIAASLTLSGAAWLMRGRMLG